MTEDLNAVRNARYFPVRHHSPRATAALHAFLTEIQPRLVLIEGPSDASSLIDVICDDETEPPVAILGYRTAGEPGSSLWPLASYSPEYAALRWARQHEVATAFIDIPTGQSLADSSPVEPVEPVETEISEPEQGAPVSNLYEACARARGYRSFEEFWEASFEAPRYEPQQFREALLAFAELSRSAGDRQIHLARDAYMASCVAKEVDAGASPETIVAVVGAAHAAALLSGDVDFALLDELPEAVPTAVTLIPFSFPRLAEQAGYGAGNRGPVYYQKAHDASCDFRRAGLEVLIEFAEQLRLRGFSASMADTIEAYRLAIVLSQMRDKAEPGLDEIREAAIATMGRGEDAAAELLWPLVIGRKLGKVASRIGRNSLQEEFWREVKERNLPQHDAPESFTLKLNNEIEVATSVFLHRLRVSEVPYAAYLGSQRFGTSAGTTQEVEPGGYEALTRARETWEAQWSPATDASLVEKIALGDTLEHVVTRELRARLELASSTGAAADVLLESVVAGAPQTVNEALRVSEQLAAADEDLPSLAHACRSLSGLVSYGTSRALSKVGDDAIRTLCVRTFNRALLRVAPACVGDDEAVAPVKQGLRTLHEVALSQPLVDKESWFQVARDIAESYAVNPSVSGLCYGLLYLAQVMDAEDVVLVIEQRLSDASEPERAAAFLEGFLQVNAMVLVKTRAVVESLDRYLTSIPTERFRDTVPLLRRALCVLGATERRYLLENIIALRNLGGQAVAAKQLLDEQDKEKLKEMTDELSDAIDELDDLL